MNVASLAASQITAQVALTQSQTQVSMVRQQNENKELMVAMLTNAIQSAPSPSSGTGTFLNVFA